MKLKRIYLFLVVLVCMYFSLNVYAAEINKDNFPDSGETKMIYGEKHVFTVVIPENWVSDADAAEQSGIPFLIRPDSDDWNNAYMYALGFDKPENSKETINSFVNEDIKNYKGSHPGIKVKE